MKVSLNWIRDYVQLPADADLKKLAYDLTMSTVEVEDATDLGASFHDMVVGVINTIEQHPNADKLKVCKTDIGGRVEDIVCGGSNLREGMKVAVALPAPCASGTARVTWWRSRKASSAAWTATA